MKFGKAYVCKSLKDYISKNDLLSLDKLESSDDNFIVFNFAITFSNISKGFASYRTNTFTKEMKEQIAKLNVGDELTFTDILLKDKDGKMYSISDFKLIIK